jgi:hypothetical protein
MSVAEIESVVAGPRLPAIGSDAPLPVSYAEVRRAIAQCQSLNQCAGWAVKAEAFAALARPARDKSLERMAPRIRARALRRAGELLREIPTARGRRYGSLPRQSGWGAHRGGAGRRTLRHSAQDCREAGADFDCRVRHRDRKREPAWRLALGISEQAAQPARAPEANQHRWWSRPRPKPPRRAARGLSSRTAAGAPAHSRCGRPAPSSTSTSETIGLPRRTRRRSTTLCWHRYDQARHRRRAVQRARPAANCSTRMAGCGRSTRCPTTSGRPSRGDGRPVEGGRAEAADADDRRRSRGAGRRPGRWRRRRRALRLNRTLAMM